jgi:hypothetical protein
MLSPLPRKPLVAIGIALGLGMFGTEIAACSSSSPAASQPPGPDSQAPSPVPSCTAGGLTIAFNPMYSAFDGTHTFQIPAVVNGSNSSVTWTADESMVGIESYTEPNEILITALNSGTTTILAQSADGKCASAPLTITAAKVSDWEIGNARYNDGRSLHLVTGATGGAGSPLEAAADGGMVAAACTNCHGETATGGPFTDVSHTPEQTGGFSDTDILNIVLHGTFPPGAYFDNNIVPYAVWQTWHKWDDIQKDQQTGIVVYLRSLTPRPQLGQPNFGFTFTTPNDSGSGGSDSGTDAASESGGAPEGGDGAATEAEAGDD